MSRAVLLLATMMIVAACDGRRMAPAAASDPGPSAAPWERVCTDRSASYCFASYMMRYRDGEEQIRTARISVTSNAISLSGDLYPGRHGVVQIDAQDPVDLPWNDSTDNARASMTPKIHQQIMAGQTMTVRFTEWPAGLGHQIRLPLARLKPLLQAPG